MAARELAIGDWSSLGKSVVQRILATLAATCQVESRYHRTPWLLFSHRSATIPRWVWLRGPDTPQEIIEFFDLLVVGIVLKVAILILHLAYLYLFAQLVRGLTLGVIELYLLLLLYHVLALLEVVQPSQNITRLICLRLHRRSCFNK